MSGNFKNWDIVYKLGHKYSDAVIPTDIKQSIKQIVNGKIESVCIRNGDDGLWRNDNRQ